jgi:molybdopterin-containing oxidoreductase family iron-sulfur binding subunit
MPEELQEKSKCLSLDEIREKLKKEGGSWRGLDEVAETAGFQELLHREFPRQAAPWSNGVDRRTFLKFMGASLALAGLTACRPQRIDKIVPYVKVPENVVPGLPVYYATALTLGGYALGAVVEAHDGRPTKIEGNENHPATLGSSSAMMQAMILDLYDPDRSKAVLNAGRPSAVDTFYKSARAALAEGKVRILTETVTSPTLGALIDEFLSRNPGSKWHQFEPVNRDNELEAAKAVFGAPVQPVYNFANAEVILSLDSDFLTEGPGAIRYARQFADGRRVRRDNAHMNRLYAVVVSPTNTSASADTRLRAKASDVEAIALAIAAGVGAGGAGANLNSETAKFVEAVVADLNEHRGSSAVVVGPYASPATHAAAFAINQALGNVGTTVNVIDAVEVRAENHADSLSTLIADIESGAVSSLFVLGGNPVYKAAGGSRLGEALAKVPFKVHLGMHEDETSELCTWHLPLAHELEAWGDARAFDGTASIIQPLIEPLYGGISAVELMDGLLGRRRNGYDIVRGQWQRGGMSGNFEASWKKALNDGMIEGSAPSPRNAAASMAAVVGLASRPGSGLEVNFRPDPTLYDGRFSNNAWMQECPRPITRVVWDNVIHISPATAEELGWNPAEKKVFGDEPEKIYGGEGWHGGEAGIPIYRLEIDGMSVEGPVWVAPGHADGCVTVTFGGGRRHGGAIQSGVGFDANGVRASNAVWTAYGAKLSATGGRMDIACTQLHHTMDSRALVQSAKVADFEHDPEHVTAHPHGPEEEMSMYPPRKWDGSAWGMSIDNTVCIGCNACVIACQSENNIPVVGKDDVLRGREMHWIRIDRYFHGSSLDDPDTLQMPVPCMQCEKAPCEVVCPVAATVHGVEGLNDMVYNRCVGTRYCANNCPYKVRRFNFYHYADNYRNNMPSPDEAPVLKLLANPDVTVRGRGVMEKCTYCVQRINEARKTAKKQNRAIEDGEIVTACQAACPTQAIVFGNINDAESQVAKLKAEPHDYSLLPELNTRPRTTYLVRITNPSPAYAGASEAGEAH